MTASPLHAARSGFAEDRIVFAPGDIDLDRSPLANNLAGQTYVLGAFNPGLTRLPSGNLLLMVRVAEALREPVFDGAIHAIRWTPHGYVLDAWPLDQVDPSDPRKFTFPSCVWRVTALTSLSWLLPVELTPDGLSVTAVHYELAVAPKGSWQCYGVEDPRISCVDGRWLMTTCSVSPERQSTTLYESHDGLHWRFHDMVLDHQNKDMVIFEGLIAGRYWAQTRPLGDLYFAYPPDSPWLPGPSINLATSPDALHWKPRIAPGIRLRANSPVCARVGGGAPPVLTKRGWLSLWHGVEPGGDVGIYRTYWSLLERENPSRQLESASGALLEANRELTGPLEAMVYLRDVVFTTGLVCAGDHFIVASGECDLACRITHIPHESFGLK